MSNQIFRKIVPKEVVFELLEKICLKTDKYYFIDSNAYKKMIYNNYHIGFIETLGGYYHVSKFFYLEREMKYNSFTNIIRQICKNNGIPFSSNMNYNHSKYNIDYFIYY